MIDGYEPTTVGSALNQEGIAVRAGHHCAQPILRRFGLEATVRASLAFYNTCEEVDRLVHGVAPARHIRTALNPTTAWRQTRSMNHGITQLRRAALKPQDLGEAGNRLQIDPAEKKPLPNGIQATVGDHGSQRRAK